MAKNSNQETVVAIDQSTLFYTLLLVVVFVAGLQFVSAARWALTLITAAFFFAMALSPLVGWLNRKIPPHNRVLSTAIAYLITLFVVGGMIYSIAPVAVRQVGSFVDAVPQYIDNLSQADNALGNFVRDLELREQLENNQDQLVSGAAGAGRPIIRGLQTFFQSAAGVLTVLVLTFFMLVEGPKWLNLFWSFHAKSKLQRRQKLAYDMYRAVTGYVNGQLIIAFISGVITLVLALILGLPYPVALAAIIAITGLIPLIGNTLGAVIVIAVALTQSFGLALFLTIFYIVYQQIENNVIQPAVQSQTVALSPLAILVSALIGISIAGFMGALLAIPVGGMIRVLALYIIDTRQLSGRI